MTDTSKFTVTKEMTDAFYSKAEVTSRGTILNLEAAIEAALAAAPEQKPSVRVKPVVWELMNDGETYHAQSILGRWAYWDGYYLPPNGYGGIPCSDPPLAAQADYERRILSAIDLQPSDDNALKAENERLREALNRVTATYANMEDGNSDPCPDIAFAKSAINIGVNTTPQRSIIDDETEILKRLADGDTIRFSQDGDMAWFTKGDGAFVGNAIISLRSKGYLKRECDDEENYRGTAEYDTISDLGRAAIGWRWS